MCVVPATGSVNHHAPSLCVDEAVPRLVMPLKPGGEVHVL